MYIYIFFSKLFDCSVEELKIQIQTIHLLTRRKRWKVKRDFLNMAEFTHKPGRIVLR